MSQSSLTTDIRTHIRANPGMYFGSSTARGVLHVVNELMSNGIDLFLHGTATSVAVSNVGDSIHYADDGPGLPCDVPGPGGVSLAEHYLTCYHNTPSADDHAPHIHLMGHGVGLVSINSVSESFKVKSWRSGRLWEQDYARGLPVAPPSVAAKGRGRGTSITFRLDRTIFDCSLPCPRSLRRLLFEAAHLFPGITLKLENEVFHAPCGLADLASLYCSQYEPGVWHDPMPFYIHNNQDGVEVSVGAAGVVRDVATKPLYRSWVNGSGTGEHGTHLDGLRDALRYVHWSPAVAMIHVIMHDPEFAGPTRGRLASTRLRKIVRERVKPALQQYQDRRYRNANFSKVDETRL